MQTIFSAIFRVYEIRDHLFIRVFRKELIRIDVSKFFFFFDQIKINFKFYQSMYKKIYSFMQKND